MKNNKKVLLVVLMSFIIISSFIAVLIIVDLKIKNKVLEEANKEIKPLIILENEKESEEEPIEICRKHNCNELGKTKCVDNKILMCNHRIKEPEGCYEWMEFKKCDDDEKCEDSECVEIEDSEWEEDCKSETCLSLGKDCGSWSDGCDGTIDCGECIKSINFEISCGGRSYHEGSGCAPLTNSLGEMVWFYVWMVNRNPHSITCEITEYYNNERNDGWTDNFLPNEPKSQRIGIEYSSTNYRNVKYVAECYKSDEESITGTKQLIVNVGWY